MKLIHVIYITIKTKRMITRHELISMLLSEYTCEISKQIAKNCYDKLKDSDFENELPVKCIRRGYFVIS